MTEEEKKLYALEIIEAELLGIEVFTCTTIGELREKIKNKIKSINNKNDLLEFIYNNNKKHVDYQ